MSNYGKVQTGLMEILDIFVVAIIKHKYYSVWGGLTFLRSLLSLRIILR